MALAGAAAVHLIAALMHVGRGTNNHSPALW
jgi:hypothetical protein